MAECRYCGCERRMPCMNTRDMTDRSIDDDQACYDALNDLGGGESGMRYVDLNRAATRRRLGLEKPDAD